MCSKCITCNLQYSRVFVEIRFSTCHQSKLDQQKHKEKAHETNLKRKNDIKVGKKKGLSHNKFSSLILINPKAIYKLIQLISFMLMGPKLINKFPNKYSICD